MSYEGRGEGRRGREEPGVGGPTDALLYSVSRCWGRDGDHQYRCLSSS